MSILVIGHSITLATCVPVPVKFFESILGRQYRREEIWREEIAIRISIGTFLNSFMILIQLVKGA